MKFFKKEPVNLIDVLTQPLWLNRHILVNKDYIYYKKYENNVISLLKVIFDNNLISRLQNTKSEIQSKNLHYEYFTN